MNIQLQYSVWVYIGEISKISIFEVKFFKIERSTEKIATAFFKSYHGLQKSCFIVRKLFRQLRLYHHRERRSCTFSESDWIPYRVSIGFSYTKIASLRGNSMFPGAFSVQNCSNRPQTATKPLGNNLFNRKTCFRAIRSA